MVFVMAFAVWHVGREMRRRQMAADGMQGQTARRVFG